MRATAITVLPGARYFDYGAGGRRSGKVESSQHYIKTICSILPADPGHTRTRRGDGHPGDGVSGHRSAVRRSAHPTERPRFRSHQVTTTDVRTEAVLDDTLWRLSARAARMKNATDAINSPAARTRDANDSGRRRKGCRGARHHDGVLPCFAWHAPAPGAAGPRSAKPAGSANASKGKTLGNDAWTVVLNAPNEPADATAIIVPVPG